MAPFIVRDKIVAVNIIKRLNGYLSIQLHLPRLLGRLQLVVVLRLLRLPLVLVPQLAERRRLVPPELTQLLHHSEVVARFHHFLYLDHDNYQLVRAVLSYHSGQLVVPVSRVMAHGLDRQRHFA